MEKLKISSIKIFDTAAIVLFMLIALVFTVGNLGNHFSTYFIMPSDASNISSFAAALDHPDYFVNDAVLNNSANFAHYDSIQVPLTRFLGQVFGSYGSAFGFLIFPVTFLHLIGYYILGIALLKKRTWALLLTLCLMVPVAMNLGENWGLVSDVIPRFLFQALLPFLLTAVIHWGHNPKSWLWLMIATGLLVYVHPVSLPVWGVSVLLSLWILASGLPLKKKLLGLSFAALAFLLVITPFTINYLSTTTFGAAEAGNNYQTILDIMRQRFIPGFIDLKVGFKEFIKTVVTSHWINLCVWVFVILAGLGFGIYSLKNKRNSLILVLAAWWVGIFIIGVTAPIIDHALAAALQRMPLEVDLIRSLRYAIPLLLISAFYLLSELQNICLEKAAVKFNRITSIGFLAVGALLLFGWMIRYQFYNNGALVQTANCWKSGHLTCPLPNEDYLNQRAELLDDIKWNTPIGSKILGTDFYDLDVRYYALRPLVYTYKDGGILIYANHKELLTWYDDFQQMDAIDRQKDDRKIYLDDLTSFGQKHQADFLILREPFQAGLYLPSGLKNVYSNPGFSLYQVIS